MRNPARGTGSRRPHDKARFAFGIIKAKDSLENNRRSIQDKLNKRFTGEAKGKGEIGAGVWIKDITPERVVFEKGNKLMAARYHTEGADVKIGPEYEVELQYSPVGKEEA